MLTTSQAIKASGVGIMRLHRWAHYGLLQPEDHAQGSGSRRRWSTTDVRIARVLAAYSDAGRGGLYDRRDIAAAIQAATEPGWVVIGTDTVEVVDDDDLAQAVLTCGSSAVVIALPPIP